MTDNILVKRKCSTNPVCMSLSNVTVFLNFFPLTFLLIFWIVKIKIKIWLFTNSLVRGPWAGETTPICFQIIFFWIHLYHQETVDFKNLKQFLMKCTFHNISQKSWLRISDTDWGNFSFSLVSCCISIYNHRTQDTETGKIDLVSSSIFRDFTYKEKMEYGTELYYLTLSKIDIYSY